MYKSLTFSIVLLVNTGVFGQEIKPRGYFTEDTVQIGEEVDFAMVVNYPRGMEVLFPDSTYNFSPFEFLGKTYQSTLSSPTSSYDSVIYKLATFELDSVQKLALPVFLVTDGDSSRIMSDRDSVVLQLMIAENIDSLQVKETIDYQKVSKAFNYPYLLIGIGILLTIAILVAVFFGKEIRRRIKLYRLRRAHVKFLERFKALQDDGLESSEKAEHLLAFWKAYLERLEGMPYTKLTTKEIVTLEQNQEFNEILRSIDSNIYGKYKSAVVHDLVPKLKSFGIDRFTRKIDELKHA